VLAVVLGAINAFVRPVLVVLTLPITILSLGLFLLVINAVLILVASAVVPGFVVSGFLWAVAFSVVLSIIGGFLKLLTGADTQA
jgi:putative membrane protein